MQTARRNWMASFGLLALAGGLSVSTARAAEHASGKSRTIRGEVVDVACWVGSGARGEKHKSCAEACAKGGGAVGILQDKTNKLFVAVAPKPGGDPKEKLTEHIAHRVEVKGTVSQRGGVATLAVASVKMLSQ